jgi:type I restriction enzyme M protein
LEKIVKALKPHGRAAVIVPDGLVENTSFKNYRMAFLMNVNLEAVVSLPAFSFLPYTNEKTYILYFSRKSHKEIGKIQNSPVWHAVVDNDGFQDGAKRYPINDDDLADIAGQDFMRRIEIARFSFVDIKEIMGNEVLALSSESYLRRHKPIEVDEDEFKRILGMISTSIKTLVADVGHVGE